MSFVPAARIFSEFAVFYTVLLMLPFRWPATLLCGTALLCGLGCSGAAVAKKTAVRCLWGILPVLSLLIPGELTLRCCMVLPVFYAELLIFTNRIYPESWRYARHVRLSMIFELLFLIIGCTLRNDRAVWILLCGNVYFLIGVYFQHQLRLGAGVSWQGRLRDFGSICILPALAAAIVGLIAGGMKPISRGVIGFVTVVGNAMRYVVALSTHLYRNPKIPVAEITAATTEVTETTMETLTEATFPETWPEMQFTPGVFWGLVIAGALLLLGLLVYGVHRFQSRPAAARGEDHWAEANGIVTERPTRARTKSGSNRKKVRRTYSAYLKLLQSRGMFRKSTDTSREVLESAKPYADPEKGGDLRSIYIRARYHTDVPVSDEDVKAAGDILRELKRDRES